MSEANMNTNPTYRTICLSEANNIVNGARQNAYGSPENSFKTIAGFWNLYLGANPPLTARQVADMMMLLKMARISSGTPTLDSYVDIAGYAACGYESLRGIIEEQQAAQKLAEEIQGSGESAQDVQHTNSDNDNDKDGTETDWEAPATPAESDAWEESEAPHAQ